MMPRVAKNAAKPDAPKASKGKAKTASQPDRIQRIYIGKATPEEKWKDDMRLSEWLGYDLAQLRKTINYMMKRRVRKYAEKKFTTKQLALYDKCANFHVYWDRTSDYKTVKCSFGRHLKCTPAEALEMKAMAKAISDENPENTPVIGQTLFKVISQLDKSQIDKFTFLDDTPGYFASLERRKKKPPTSSAKARQYSNDFPKLGA